MSSPTKSLLFQLLGVDKTGAATKSARSNFNLLGGAVGKLGGILGGEFGGALQSAGDDLDQLGTKGIDAGKKLEIAGGLVTGLGVALTLMGSKEVKAQAQLKKAVEDSGHSYADYADNIEKAIQKGEDLDHNAVDVQSALQKLTQATGNPTKALKLMTVTENLAAEQHISLAKAATQVALIYGGKGTRVLNKYGITMDATANSAKILAAAQKDLERKSSTLQDAQEHLKITEQELAGESHLTAAQQGRLALAHYNVQKASKALKGAQDYLTTAQKNSTKANLAGQKALDQLSKKLKGQASTSVDNFGSQLDIIKTKVIDWADAFGAQFGPAIAGFGGVVETGGVILELYAAHQENVRIAAQAATTALDEEKVATIGLEGVMDATPIYAVAVAIGVLAAVAGAQAITNQQNLTQAVEDYSAALKADNEVLGRNTRLTIANNLLKDGSLKAAEHLGISGQLLVKATLGEKSARAELNKELDAQSTKLHALLRETMDGQKVDGLNHDQVVKLILDYQTLTDGYGTQTSALKSATKQQILLNAAQDGGALTAQQEKKRLDQLLASFVKFNKEYPNGAVYNGSGLVPAPSTGGSKKKPHAARGAIVNPRPGGVDVNVAEAGSAEAILPLPKGFSIESLGRGSGTVHVHNTYNTYNVRALTAKDENEYARNHKRVIARAERRGAVSTRGS